VKHQLDVGLLDVMMYRCVFVELGYMSKNGVCDKIAVKKCCLAVLHIEVLVMITAPNKSSK